MINSITGQEELLGGVAPDYKFSVHLMQTDLWLVLLLILLLMIGCVYLYQVRIMPVKYAITSLIYYAVAMLLMCYMYYAKYSIHNSLDLILLILIMLFAFTLQLISIDRWELKNHKDVDSPRKYSTTYIIDMLLNLTVMISIVGIVSGGLFDFLVNIVYNINEILWGGYYFLQYIM